MKKRGVKKESRKKMNRSGSCSCDICNSQEFLSVHHIKGRDIPNFNHPSNCCNLCGNCHNNVHHGLMIIEEWLLTTNGLKLFWHYVEQSSFSGRDSKTYIIPS